MSNESDREPVRERSELALSAGNTQEKGKQAPPPKAVLPKHLQADVCYPTGKWCEVEASDDLSLWDGHSVVIGDVGGDCPKLLYMKSVSIGVDDVPDGGVLCLSKERFDVLFGDDATKTIAFDDGKTIPALDEDLLWDKFGIRVIHDFTTDSRFNYGFVKERGYVSYSGNLPEDMQMAYITFEMISLAVRAAAELIADGNPLPDNNSDEVARLDEVGAKELLEGLACGVEMPPLPDMGNYGDWIDMRDRFLSVSCKFDGEPARIRNELVKYKRCFEVWMSVLARYKLRLWSSAFSYGGRGIRETLQHIDDIAGVRPYIEGIASNLDVDDVTLGLPRRKMRYPYQRWLEE